MRAFSLAAAIALTLQGCSFPEVTIAPGKRNLVIHAVLDAGARDQLVFVTYSNSNSTAEPVKGATVTLITPDGVQMTGAQDTLPKNDEFAGPQSGTYRISLAKYGVVLQPGATYSLRVRTPSGEDATGTTTMPQAAAVSLVPPSENFFKERDTLKLVWAPVAGAASYEVNLSRAYQINGRTEQAVSSRFVGAPITYVGNERVPFEEEPLFQRGSQTIAMVAAVDVNYYEYYRVLSDPFYGAAPSRLTGAIGVFGSIVPIVVRRLDVR